jgi:hypothetical protein
MKIVAVICNVAFWGFFCIVMLTDGPPKGTDILLSLIPFLMPILNVLVIRVLPSPGRVVKVVALVSNIVWLGLACWLIMDRYPSHPKEEGFIEYVALKGVGSVFRRRHPIQQRLQGNALGRLRDTFRH